MTPKQIRARSVQKAVECAELLVANVREAHTAHCQEKPSPMEHELRTVHGEACRLQDRLKLLLSCSQ
jgi:hypothetical protein